MKFDELKYIKFCAIDSPDHIKIISKLNSQSWVLDFMC